MRKIKEVLRLKWAAGLSNCKIAASCGIGRPTVSEYLRWAEEARLAWLLSDDLDDVCLERLLFLRYRICQPRAGHRRPGAHPRRAQAQGRNSVPVLAGVPA